MLLWLVGDRADDVQDAPDRVPPDRARTRAASRSGRRSASTARRSSRSRTRLRSCARRQPRRYVSVYPYVRSLDWYLLPEAERAEMLREHGMMGRSRPEVRANTVSAFALGDYEWLLAFECDELEPIVDLMRQCSAARRRDATRARRSRSTRAGGARSARSSRTFPEAAGRATPPVQARRRVNATPTRHSRPPAQRHRRGHLAERRPAQRDHERRHEVGRRALARHRRARERVGPGREGDRGRPGAEVDDEQRARGRRAADLARRAPGANGRQATVPARHAPHVTAIAETRSSTGFSITTATM